MDTYLYLDTETTGLGPQDCAYQVAWQFEAPPHLRRMEVAFVEIPAGVEISDYTRKSRAYEQYLRAAYRWRPEDVWGAISAEIEAFRARLGGNVFLVGANPAFDDRMLRKMGGGWAPGYHHRLIDVEAYAMGRERAAVPSGLATLAKRYVPNFGEQDHEAASDVRALVAAFAELRK
jgi:hypothetical protein